jgi:two-component system, sensor histidine kinase and response regulator
VRRILVIDDEAELRALIVAMLTEEGYEVVTAADGESGLALAHQNPPDLILCDVRMTGLDGYAVLRALRQDPETALIPVIFLTGVGGDDALRKGMNLGADDYLIKPIAQALLAQTIRARLDRFAAVRQEAQRRFEAVRTDLARSLLPHELLTPLTAVIGLSSMLAEDGVAAVVDVQEVARGILLGGQKLEEMITKFLLYAELQTEGHAAAGVGLGAERVGTVVSTRARAKAARVDREADLDIQVGDGASPMSSDHLQALLDELVGNALKFSQPNSRVSIRCRAEGPAWVLSVADRGRGMTSEQLAGLERHAPFLRRQQEQAGLGLGLTIVRQLASLYGGDITLDTVPGQGTTVHVRFPPPSASRPSVGPAAAVDA